MTTKAIAEARERAAQPVSIAHNRAKLAKDLAAAREDVRALADALEKLIAVHERDWVPR